MMKYSLVPVLLALYACSTPTTVDPTCKLPVSMPAVSGDTVSTSSGLQYIQTRSGSGPVAEAGMEVTVKYAGYLLDGRNFDAGQFGFRLGMGQVVRGFDEGIRGMSVGEQRRLILPPELGYGPRTVGCIPPGSTLIFDVELVNAG